MGMKTKEEVDADVLAYFDQRHAEMQRERFKRLRESDDQWTRGYYDLFVKPIDNDCPPGWKP